MDVAASDLLPLCFVYVPPVVRRKPQKRTTKHAWFEGSAVGSFLKPSRLQRAFLIWIRKNWNQKSLILPRLWFFVFGCSDLVRRNDFGRANLWQRIAASKGCRLPVLNQCFWSYLSNWFLRSRDMSNFTTKRLQFRGIGPVFGAFIGPVRQEDRAEGRGYRISSNRASSNRIPPQSSRYWGMRTANLMPYLDRYDKARIWIKHKTITTTRTASEPHWWDKI